MLSVPVFLSIETAGIFIVTVGTVPAAAFAAVPALKMVLLGKNNIAFGGFIVVAGF